MSHRTYQERGYCTRAGYARLDEVLGQLCDLGNAALQERRDAWRIARKRISYQDQCRSLTPVRQDEPAGLGRLNVAATRGGPPARRPRLPGVLPALQGGWQARLPAVPEPEALRSGTARHVKEERHDRRGVLTKHDPGATAAAVRGRCPRR